MPPSNRLPSNRPRRAPLPRSRALRRKGQLATVRRLLDLGANPNGAVPAAAAEDTGERPLASAVPLASEGAAAANAVVLELLRREADPLASPSVWGQPDAILHGTVLSHASGTPLEEALSPESGVPLLLDHLERQAAAGCLVFRSAGVAVVSACTCCCCCWWHGWDSGGLRAGPALRAGRHSCP